MMQLRATEWREERIEIGVGGGSPFSWVKDVSFWTPLGNLRL